MLLKKYFGDKKFFSLVFTVAMPIMIQTGITSFVGLLDNIMVGQTGTEQMSGVSIANQLIFIFNLCVFGAVSGAGIFTAQFYGKGDNDGIRNTFRIKIILVLLIGVAAIVIFALFSSPLISLFLHGTSDVGDLDATLNYGRKYLFVMLVSLVPFGIMQSYASTLRETGETLFPMKAGFVAVMINLCFNWLLIFGKCGFPELGVVGAAIATVISRIVEMLIVVIWTHTHTGKAPYAKGLYKEFKIPSSLVMAVVRRGTPLMVNEALWSIGMTTLTQCYSTRGLIVVAAFSISNTICNFFDIVMHAMGQAIAIILGKYLGRNDMEQAKDYNRKLLSVSVCISIIIALLLAATAPFFADFYNTSSSVKNMAANLMRVVSLFMPINFFVHCSYFTIRSGGKTFITFLFDSGFLFVINVPLVYALAHFTGVPIIPLYIISQSTNIIKCIIGFVLIKKDVWLNNIVS